MNGNLDLIKTEFTKQAPSFNDYQETDVKRAFNFMAIEQMRLSDNENVLENSGRIRTLARSVARSLSIRKRIYFTC